MRSDFLFAEPSWKSGAGRVLDLLGVFQEFNDSPTPEIADERALFADWRIGGEDLWQAAKKIEHETAEGRKPVDL